MKVFLSSTYLDLIEYRQAAKQALERLGQQVGGMEIFGARDEEPKKVALAELEKCDLMVGIYAHRYGSILEDEELSITEQEFLNAKSKGIPVFCFMINDEQAWPPKMMETDVTKKRKLDDFKAKLLREKTVDYFTSPADLGMKIGTTIGNHLTKIANSRMPSSKSLSSIPIATAKQTTSSLPSQPYFFGREKELSVIADAISPESRTWGALIDGPGGIGKTALAIRAAQLAPATLFDRKIFLTAKIRELTPEGERPLRDFTYTDYLSMINELALELGEDNIPRLPPENRADALRLALTGKKVLVVIDNLETFPEGERSRLFQILSRLPQGNKAIVTSRRRADIDARVVRLDRLEANEALQLIAELAKSNPKLARTREKERQDLYEITNGNPLFIRWITGQLGREGSQCRTIADAYAFLEKAPQGNDPLEYIFGDLLETFSEHETYVLAALTHFVSPARLSWIAEMTGLVERVCETALDDLADRSVLISNAEMREYFLPPLAAKFIKTRRTEAVQQTGGKLANRVYALAMQFGGDSGNKEDYSRLDSEWSSVTAALPNLLNGDNSLLQSFVSAIFQYLNFYGKWDEIIWINLYAEQKALSASDKLNAGWRAYQTGWVHYLRGQALRVLTYSSRAENFWHSAGVREKSMAIRLRGIGHELEHDYQAAIVAYNEVLELRRTINPQSDDVAIAIYDLGSAERQSGNYEAADRHYREAYEIDKRNNSQEGIAMYMSNQGVLALDRKKWSEAEMLARNSLELGEKLGRKELIANNCCTIAKAALSLKRPLEGISYARRAVTIYTDLGSPNVKVAQETIIECQTVIEEEKIKQAEDRGRSKYITRD
jgi:tetratricopeptide (TPR) repeat protein